jgi:hypothetical protein
LLGALFDCASPVLICVKIAWASQLPWAVCLLATLLLSGGAAVRTAVVEWRAHTDRLHRNLPAPTWQSRRYLAERVDGCAALVTAALSVLLAASPGIVNFLWLLLPLAVGAAYRSALYFWREASHRCAGLVCATCSISFLRAP